MEAIDGTEQGTFAREGCPALGHAWPLPGPPNNARKRIPLAGPPSHPLSSLARSHCLWPSGALRVPSGSCSAVPKAVGPGPACGLWTHINCRLLTKIGRRILLSAV